MEASDIAAMTTAEIDRLIALCAKERAKRPEQQPNEAQHEDPDDQIVRPCFHAL